MEEARLLISLQLKLDDLEARIRAYRGDLIHDFHRHCRGLLSDVSPDVASSVRRAIVPSFDNYPFLRPEFESPADSRLQPGVAFLDQATLAPGEPLQGETAREREDELRGLFTPSYLPLLEATSPKRDIPSPARIPSIGSLPASPALEAAETASTFSSATRAVAIETKTKTAAAAATAAATATTMIPGDRDSLSITTHPAEKTQESVDVVAMDGLLDRPCGATPPEPQTDIMDMQAPTGRGAPSDSPSSVCSDKSDSKTRKSALRRSTSLSKPPQSPRRVRFEVMGAEVLPTASPQASEFPSTGVTLPYLEDESISLNNILDGDLNLPRPPPKISSSEALRALSRRPLEEGTIWTVVNPVIEEDDMETDQQQQQRQIPGSFTGARDSMEALAAVKIQSESGSSLEEGGQYRGLPLEELEAADNAANDYSSDEDDYLSMYSLRSSRNPPNPNPGPSLPRPKELFDDYTTNAAAPVIPQEASSETSVSEEAKDQDVSDDDFDDDVFQFEPGGLTAPPKPRQQKPQPPLPDSDPDSDSDDGSHETTSSPNREQTDHHPGSESPTAVSISKSSRTDPDASPASKFQPASIGSYKGRPVVMPVVRDPEVYALAASLGKFNTFVGGLDGRSGIDEGDLSSFRNSVIAPTFVGEPRSFTERLIMEDARDDLMKETARIERLEEARAQRVRDEARRERMRRESQARKAKEAPSARAMIEAASPEMMSSEGQSSQPQ